MSACVPDCEFGDACVEDGLPQAAPLSGRKVPSRTSDMGAVGHDEKVAALTIAGWTIDPTNHASVALAHARLTEGGWTR